MRDGLDRSEPTHFAQEGAQTVQCSGTSGLLKRRRGRAECTTRFRFFKRRTSVHSVYRFAISNLRHLRNLWTAFRLVRDREFSL